MDYLSQVTCPYSFLGLSPQFFNMQWKLTFSVRKHFEKWRGVVCVGVCVCVCVGRGCRQWRSQGLPGWATRPPGAPK